MHEGLSKNVDDLVKFPLRFDHLQVLHALTHFLNLALQAICLGIDLGKLGSIRSLQGIKVALNVFLPLSQLNFSGSAVAFAFIVYSRP